MTLDKRTLSGIDRKIGAELDTQERFRMVRVPIDDRRWSIWNRYCQTAGISMGRGIALLIEQALAAFATGTSKEVVRDVIPVEAEDNLAAQQAAVADIEERLALEARRLQQWERQLEYRRDELRRMELRLRSPATPQPTSPRLNVGRNDPCPCGSGVKFKRCHGA